MKIFIAGATGVIGRPLTAQLFAANHEVVAMTRSDERAADLKQGGSTPVVCDVLDREKLHRCLADAHPVVGPYATYLMCDQRGASNAKAKRELDWSLTFPTWRSGFREMLTRT